MQIDYAVDVISPIASALLRSTLITHIPESNANGGQGLPRPSLKNGRITKPIPNKMILECDHPFIRRDDPPGADGIRQFAPRPAASAKASRAGYRGLPAGTVPAQETGQE